MDDYNPNNCNHSGMFRDPKVAEYFIRITDSHE